MSLEAGGLKLSNSQAIAKAFNNYFSTVMAQVLLTLYR